MLNAAARSRDSYEAPRADPDIVVKMERPEI